MVACLITIVISASISRFWPGFHFCSADASQPGLGVVLYHNQEGQVRIIGCESCTPTPVKRSCHLYSFVERVLSLAKGHVENPITTKLLNKTEKAISTWEPTQTLVHDRVLVGSLASEPASAQTERILHLKGLHGPHPKRKHVRPEPCRLISQASGASEAKVRILYNCLLLKNAF